MMKNLIGSAAMLFAILASAQSVHGQATAVVGSAVDVTQSNQEKTRLITIAKIYLRNALSSVTSSDREAVKRHLVDALRYIKPISSDEKTRLIITEINTILENLNNNTEMSNIELIRSIALVTEKLERL